MTDREMLMKKQIELTKSILKIRLRGFPVTDEWLEETARKIFEAQPTQDGGASNEG